MKLEEKAEKPVQNSRSDSSTFPTFPLNFFSSLSPPGRRRVLLPVFDHQVTRLIRHLLDLQRDIRRTVRHAQIADVVVIVLVALPLENRRWNDD
jgi:hypothetical protein